MDELNPIFVVGCPRSGTTLLAALLDRHSEVAVTPETHFLTRFASRNSLANRQPDEIVDLILSDPYLRDLGLDSADLEKRFAGPSCSSTAFEAILRSYLAQKNKSIIAEKTPGHLYHVDKLIDWFPTARFLCIIRDGRDVAFSMQKQGWGVPLFRKYCYLWKCAAKELIPLESKYPDRLHVVRFEALLSDEESQLTEVMEFLGLRTEPSQFDARNTTSVVPSWETDWKGKANSSVDKQRAYAWKGHITPRREQLAHSLISEELRHFGYEAGSRTGNPLLSGWDQVSNLAISILFSRNGLVIRNRVRQILENVWNKDNSIQRPAR